MAGPHPVVRIAAELADRGGRRTDQAHVAENVDHEREILVAAEERTHGDLLIRMCRLKPTGKCGNVVRDHAGPLLTAGDIGYVAQHVGRHVGDLADEPHLQPRSGNLLLVGTGPETVFQVVVLHRREGLDLRIAAMVVGKDQSFGRHHLARAAGTEDHDGILERGVIHGIDLLG